MLGGLDKGSKMSVHHACSKESIGVLDSLKTKRRLILDDVKRPRDWEMDQITLRSNPTPPPHMYILLSYSVLYQKPKGFPQNKEEGILLLGEYLGSHR